MQDDNLKNKKKFFRIILTNQNKYQIVFFLHHFLNFLEKLCNLKSVTTLGENLVAHSQKCKLKTTIHIQNLLKYLTNTRILHDRKNFKDQWVNNVQQAPQGEDDNTEVHRNLDEIQVETRLWVGISNPTFQCTIIILQEMEVVCKDYGQ